MGRWTGKGAGGWGDGLVDGETGSWLDGWTRLVGGWTNDRTDVGLGKQAGEQGNWSLSGQESGHQKEGLKAGWAGALVSRRLGGRVGWQWVDGGSGGGVGRQRGIAVRKQRGRWGLTPTCSSLGVQLPSLRQGLGSPLLQQAAEVQLSRVFGLPFTPVAIERGCGLR